MKERRGIKTGRQGLIQAVTAIALVMVLLILPFASGRAAFDENAPVSLTVKPGSEDLSPDIDNAGIVIDLYKIADGKQYGTFDTYEFVQKTNSDGSKDKTYGSLFSGEDASITNKDITTDLWREVANKAAAIALDGQTPDVSGVEVNSKIDDLSCGLYLIVARDKTADEYEVGKQEDGNVVTVAKSERFVYTFKPELVALPSKTSDITAGDVIRTDDAGDWITDVSITLKPERRRRTAPLEITKIIEKYEDKDAATFLFEIEGTLEDEMGTYHYSNVIPIKFDGPDSKTKLVGEFPVGMQLTIKEVYSGHVYKLKAGEDNPKTTTIKVGGAKVEFENDYNDEYHGGGSVTNSFSYDGENGWVCVGTDERDNVLVDTGSKGE